MEESINFYTKLFQIEPVYKNRERWVSYNLGNCLALYSLDYDLERLAYENDYNSAYKQYVSQESTISGKNIIINLSVDDLKKEYERLKNLDIGKITDIMYVNVTMPYWFFIIIDPDGNEVEIEGNYRE